MLAKNLTSNTEMLVVLCEVFIVISLGCLQFALDIAIVGATWM
jgi:hypothetical protein